MPRQRWSPKRERHYDQVTDGLQRRGRSKRAAKQIAARVVNKERARSGEAKTAIRTSTRDISSGRRGGLRSRSGPGGRAVEQLRNEARRRGLSGYSQMRKAELERVLGRSRGRRAPVPPPDGRRWSPGTPTGPSPITWPMGEQAGRYLGMTTEA